MLQQENLSLVTQNARLEADVGKLNDKLESIEGNFKEMVQYEKTKVRIYVLGFFFTALRNIVKRHKSNGFEQ